MREQGNEGNSQILLSAQQNNASYFDGERQEERHKLVVKIYVLDKINRRQAQAVQGEMSSKQQDTGIGSAGHWLPGLEVYLDSHQDGDGSKAKVTNKINIERKYRRKWSPQQRPDTPQHQCSGRG